MLFNRKLNLPLDGLVAGPITVSPWEKEQSQLWCPHCTCWSQFACLWEPSELQLASEAVPGASCSSCRQPVLGPRSGSCVPSRQSIRGQLGERVAVALSAWYHHSDRWDRGDAGEVKSIHRHANTSGGHMQDFSWECQLRYPTAQPSGIHASPGCLWLKVLFTISKKDHKQTDLSFAHSCFSVKCNEFL